MASLQNSPTLHQTLFHNSFPQKHGASRSSRRESISFIVKAAQVPSQSNSTGSLSQDRPGRRQVIAIGSTTPLVFLFNQHSYSFAAENKKGYLPVLDKKDGYQFLYPFGWQEVVIEGQDKVFKDVIEPLESVSVNMIPTGKQDIREFGSPQQVGETLIKKVLAPPTQKTKIIEATEQDIDGKAYYRFEFIAQAPNYTRHALSTVSIGNGMVGSLLLNVPKSVSDHKIEETLLSGEEQLDSLLTITSYDFVPCAIELNSFEHTLELLNIAGKFYTLTTGANERRWGKMKDRLQTVIDSFKIFNV